MQIRFNKTCLIQTWISFTFCKYSNKITAATHPWLGSSRNPTTLGRLTTQYCPYMQDNKSQCIQTSLCTRVRPWAMVCMCSRDTPCTAGNQFIQGSKPPCFQASPRTSVRPRIQVTSCTAVNKHQSIHPHQHILGNPRIPASPRAPIKSRIQVSSSDLNFQQEHRSTINMDRINWWHRFKWKRVDQRAAENSRSPYGQDDGWNCRELEKDEILGNCLFECVLFL